MSMVTQCNPVVRNGNKEITDALIKAIKDEASKRGWYVMNWLNIAINC